MVYLTVRYTQLAEAYNRLTNTLQPRALFGISIGSVVETENSGFLILSWSRYASRYDGVLIVGSVSVSNSGKHFQEINSN